MVVASVVTFELIQTVAVGFFTTNTDRSLNAGTLFDCGIICHDHHSCGGFVWNWTWAPRCRLVVERSEPGSVPISSKSAYRMMDYGGRMLRELVPSEGVTWQSSYDACSTSTVPMKLMTHAKTPKERAITSIRRHFYGYIDLQLRESDGAYVDHNGEVADMTLINWTSSNPDGGSEVCVGLGYEPLAYFDYTCDYADNSDYGVICIE